VHRTLGLERLFHQAFHNRSDSGSAADLASFLRAAALKAGFSKKETKCFIWQPLG
jgi:hypothetical protein